MPKRDEEYWRNQGSVRYCSKHRRWYSADVGCQLCGYEALNGQENSQNQHGAKLQKCPSCREKTLYWNSKFGFYECLNKKCRMVFAQDDIPFVEGDSEPSESGKRVKDCLTPSKKGQSDSTQSRISESKKQGKKKFVRFMRNYDTREGVPVFKIPKGRIVVLALLLGFILWMFLGMPGCQRQPGEPVSEETASGITSPQTGAQNSDGDGWTDNKTSTPEPTLTPTLTTTPSLTPSNTTAPQPGPRDILLGVDFGAIDQHALNAPESVENSIDSLAAYLTEPAKNDLQKVRAIYRWITDNISYNIEGYMAEDYGDVSPDSVLASGTSVCEGYSNLFEALAEAAGLEAVTIGGWGKGYTYTVGDPLADTNHAWNAVKIGEGWYLLDCTWGAGAVTKDGDYIKRFEDFFFLTPPQDFVYGHLPEDPKWQLLSDPLSKHEFAEAPCRALGFFKYNLKLGNPKKGSLKVENDITVTIKTPDNVVLSADLLRDDKNMPRYLISSKRSAESFEIRTVFPEPGEYVLRVWAKEKEVPEDPTWALDYKINVTEGNPDFKGFPQTGAAFSKCNLELESHNQYILKVEGDVVITIGAPENVLLLASLLQDNTALPDYYTFCQWKDGRYQIKAVFPEPGEYTLRLFAKEKEAPGDLSWGLDYKVEVSRGIPKAQGFPETYSTFQESGSFLYSPMERNLQPGNMQNFKIEVPKAQEVAVIVNDQWHHLSKSGGVFEGHVRVSKGDAEVFARFPNEENFWALLRYLCE